MCASQNGHLEVVSQLLSRGARLNEVAHNGETALSMAILSRHQTVVDELVKYGAGSDRSS